MQTVTGEEYCANCGAETYPFISSSSFYKGTYSYCKNVDCYFATFYDNTYEVARKFYINNKVNAYGFEFYDPNEKINNIVEEPKEPKEPKEYKLELNDVIGMESIKRQLRRVVNVRGNKRIHCLIISEAGQSKTHLLKSMEKELTDQKAKCAYIDAVTASRSGIYDVLFEDNYTHILADELDKLSVDDQYGLLSLAESGLLQQTTSRKRREKHVKNLTIIAAGNYIDKIVQPLLTRFLVLYIKPYSQDEFIRICSEMLQKRFDYVNADLAKYIAHKTLEYKKGNPNMRDSVRMALLVQPNPSYEEIDKIVEDLKLNDVPEDMTDNLKIEV